MLPEMRAGQISANVRNFLFGLLFAGALGAYAFAVYQAAWLCDDAYITFRVIDNLWHGYGLRWNVAERVQPYTHPLWLWVLALPLGITREFFLTPMFFSMGVALAAALFALLRFARSLGGVILAGLLFVSSRAFVEYSTSGLENPLAYLLFALFCAVALRRENEPSSVMRQTASVQSAVRGPLFRLTFLSTLLMLTRADYALVCFPFLVYEAWYGVSVELQRRWFWGFCRWCCGRCFLWCTTVSRFPIPPTLNWEREYLWAKWRTRDCCITCIVFSMTRLHCL